MNWPLAVAIVLFSVYIGIECICAYMLAHLPEIAVDMRKER